MAEEQPDQGNNNNNQAKGKGVEDNTKKKKMRASFPPKKGIYNPFEQAGGKLGVEVSEARTKDSRIKYPGKGGREIKDMKKELNAKLLEVAAEDQPLMDFVESAASARDALVALLSANDPNITPLSFTANE